VSGGAVHGVGVDRSREIGANRSRGCLGRIGGAHQLAVLGDGVLTFQNLDHDGTGDHEIHQRAKKRALAMNSVKALGFGARQEAHLRRDDMQPVRLEASIDFSDDIAGDGIGLDDGKRAFHGHALTPTK
jgi:hypothetical protein